MVDIKPQAQIHKGYGGNPQKEDILMNNLKKQVLSAAVAASTVLSLIPAASAAIPADVKGTRYE